MSGIVGLLHRDGRDVSSAMLDEMIRALAHRGAHTPAVWRDRSTGLANVPGRHSRSSLVSGSEQPGDGVQMVTADARLDNRAELRRHFGLSTPLHLIGDDELIGMAYGRWGERCVEHLRGDFAFVLFDGRRDTLFCARDRFGVRPLYYHLSSTLFAAASEIKALLRTSGLSRELNHRRIADYLTGGMDDTEETFYAAIRRLPPAHTMMVTTDGMAIRRYWMPDVDRQIELGSDREYEEAFRDLFMQSVRSRMQGETGVGALLSGGLDSSSIVCAADLIARERGGAHLHTLSAIFPDSPECDERRYIDAVLAGRDLRSCSFDASAASPMHGITELLRHHDEPFFTPNLFVHARLFAEAGEAGIGVVLDGFDGDTVVSHGAGYLSELARRGRWGSFMAEADGIARNFNIPRYRVIWRRGVKELMPAPLRQPALARRRRQELARIGAMLTPDLVRDAECRERASEIIAERSRPSRSARHDHVRRLMSGMIPFTLEVLDRTGSYRGIEPRYPFFEQQLVEFCLALPGDQKVRQGWTRSIMRRALAGMLPREIVYRGGKGMPGRSFARTLLACERDRLDDLLLRDVQCLEPYLNIDHTRTIYRRYLATGMLGDALHVWRAATLGAWLKTYA